ncbi:SDR family NAD(P)-dependent oxidoreductase [Stagnihabitans tardus]|uniref:SDR family NAD(P)-dependent oxidoreductase n=1 Tax=Stagnihabitans tardus TaxID=2699202 RepID=A0AAE4YDE5_9RHOB|nr:SDR family NAD(P)-dependent oxidoreductase [Stagnihabitans tardus]NBZ88244.1 SDR family NAD(P)-dependent oxidoreductase [Stagnihabitans tardus]
MERALVVGHSGGIGAALASALTAQGVAVTGLGRAEGLDVTDEASVAAALGGLEPGFDLVFVATGALVIGARGPEKTLRALDPAALAAQFALNATGPLLVLKHALRLMPRDRACHFAALSARVGSIGDNHLGGWYAYRAAKAALNQLIHTAAIEVARTHPGACLLALHPGTVDTRLTAAHRGSHPAVPPAEAAANLLSVLSRCTASDSGRFVDAQGLTIPW